VGISKNDTAIVFIDPQNEVLSEKGVANPLWGAPRISRRVDQARDRCRQTTVANTRPREDGHRRKVGRPSFAIMPIVSHR
jgi:hypothetical protein